MSVDVDTVKRVAQLARIAVSAEDAERMTGELNVILGLGHKVALCEQMADPSLTLFVARDSGGRPVGMGALKDHGAGLGEVKRMFTLPEVRGQRVGARILERIEELAREKGIRRLVLETGEASGFEPAYRVYERAGFTPCGAVLDYPDSGYSRFYEKTLA